MIHTAIRRFLILTVFLVSVNSAIAQASQFLTLPYTDLEVSLEQGWFYSEPGPFVCPVSEGGDRCHKGLDYFRPDRESFEIVAAAPGKAVVSEERDGYGFFALVAHEEQDQFGRRYFTLYAHLEEDSWNLPRLDLDFVRLQSATEEFSSWQDVGAGEFLGRAGKTGGWSVVHLHFEVTRGGYALDKADPYDIFGSALQYPEPCGSSFLWIECPPEIPALSLIPDVLVAATSSNDLIELDRVTGAPIRTIGPVGFGVRAITFDRSSGILYGVRPTNQLLTVDLFDGHGEAVGTGLGVPGSVSGLTFGPDGLLYGIANGDGSTTRLFVASLDTGQAALIGGVIEAKLEGIAFDPESEKTFVSLNWFLFPGDLLEIDLSDGTVRPTGNQALSGPNSVRHLADIPESTLQFGIRAFNVFAQSLELPSSKQFAFTELGFVDPETHFFSFLRDLSGVGGIEGIEMVHLPEPPPPPPGPMAEFLAFTEGDPGVPGDGVSIERFGGDDSTLFELLDPTSLDDVTNGITLTVFFPPADGVPGNLIVNLAPLERTGVCADGADFGQVFLDPFFGVTFDPVEINGAIGTAMSVPRIILDEIVADANFSLPGCDFSLAEFSVTSFGPFILSPQSAEIEGPNAKILDPFSELDAAVIGFATNVVP